jgi:hypothetical protein
MRTDPQSPTRAEMMVHLEVDKKRLAMLPTAEKTMPTTLRKERARVNKIWTATGYGRARQRLSRALRHFEMATF